MDKDNADLSKRVFVECECGSFDHVMQIALWDWNNYDKPDQSDPPELFAVMRIDQHEYWYQRVWTAIKYVFKYNDLSYHDVLIDRASAKRIKNMCQDYETAYELYDLGIKNGKQ